MDIESSTQEDGSQKVANDYLELLKTSFEWRYRTGNDVWSHEKALRAVTAWLLEHMDGHPPLKVLDVGIGTACNTTAVLEAGHHVTGIDLIEPPVWESLRQRWGDALTLICSPFQEWQGPKQAFDFALDLGCLHHQHPAEYSSYLRKVAAHLKPQGRFGLCVYEEPGENTEHGRMETTDHGRLAKCFTLVEAGELLASAGFKVRAVQRIHRPALDRVYLALVGELTA
jgi:cyclopropane fatty-acyl-phospholipid synthase-like methyltransferase